MDDQGKKQSKSKLTQATAPRYQKTWLTARLEIILGLQRPNKVTAEAWEWGLGRVDYWTS